ncbi:MAG: hypothetical protein WED07_10500 [Candidatus Freyarchaeum deiterrae]
MARDKIYGAIILIVAVVIILWYSWITLVYGVFIGSQVDNGTSTMQLLLAYYGNTSQLLGFNTLVYIQYYFSFSPIFGGLLSLVAVPPRFVAVAIPIWLAVTLILVIAAWIGYTMLTTPPPVPLEELEKAEEEEGEEGKESKAKAKKKK